MTKQVKNKSKEKEKVKNSGNAMTTSSILFKVSIVVLAFILYGRSIDFGFTLDDDLFYVKNQTVLQGVKGIPQLFQENSLFGFFRSNNIDDVYRPLTLSSFAIQKELFGVSAKAGHIFNIFTYILTGLALFSFLRRLFTEWPLLIPGAISLLFIAHPIHTEVVCSIKSRDEIMSCFFGFMALRAVVINLDKKTLWSYVQPSIWFLLALFTKESSITFLAIVPLIPYFKGSNDYKDIGKKLLPFAVCAGLFLFIRSQIVTGNTDFSRSQEIYNGLNAANNFNELYGTRFYILLLFLKQSIFPYPLSFDYSYNQIPIVGLSNPLSIASMLLHAGLIYMMIRFLIKRHPMAFGLAFFFITSVITNNFFMIIGATFAERFLFVPVAGILIFLFAAVFQIYKNAKDRQKVNNMIRYGALTVLLLYSGITLGRVPDWKDNFSLYLTGVETAPNSARAHAALGSEYRVMAEQSTNLIEKNQYYDKAVAEYKRSIEILPKYVEPLYNLGIVAYARQDTLSALDWYKKSIAVVPYYRNSLHNLGVIYLYKNELDSAQKYLQSILKHYPDDQDVLINISYMYLLKKDWDKSKFYAELGIKRYPSIPSNYRNLAAAYAASGDSVNARRAWEQFIAVGGKP